MALTYGIESLAAINKGGGLRRLASGQTTDYLRGDMTWAAFPTEMAPTAHTHLYAGSATAGGPATTALACTGNAATATKLATTRALTIGSAAKNFDGSAPVSWTLAEIGAAPATHTHDAGDIVTSALAVGNGGTGRQSFDINALIMGGTQYNGSLQSLPSGLTREVLAGGGIATSPRWLSFDEYERFSVGGTAQASATQISAKTGISEKLVFIDPGAETTPQTVSYFKAPAASGQEYGDRIVLYCCSGNDTYKYIVVPSGTEKFCDLIGGQYTGDIEASYGNKIELVCLPKSGAKAWYVSRIALINNN